MFGFKAVSGFIPLPMPNQPTLKLSNPLQKNRPETPQKEKFHLSLYYHVFRGFDCELFITAPYMAVASPTFKALPRMLLWLLVRRRPKPPKRQVPTGGAGLQLFRGLPRYLGRNQRFFTIKIPLRVKLPNSTLRNFLVKMESILDWCFSVFRQETQLIHKK